MSLRWVPVALLLVAVAAFAQDGGSLQSSAGYASPRVDFGIVVSDIDKSLAFYTKALGLTETRHFTVSGEFGKSVGLSDNLPFTVHVLQAGDGPAATQVKLMQFEGTRPARPDNSYIHSTYGVRYLTFVVSDLKAALDRAAAQGAKPLAEGSKAIPADVAPGMAIALLHDPDGNTIELVGPTKR